MDNQLTKRSLSQLQAEKLIFQHGLNEIKETKQFTLLKSFLSQFNNFLMILLMISGIVSLAIGERLDSFFIFVIVFLNAGFGLFQEFKAEKALSSLKNMTVTKVRVVRDGRETEIDSRYLVPQDLIYLEEGAKIPADCEILKSWHLEVNESTLTGESMPVPKSEEDQNNNQIFMGTSVSKGRCYGLITKTGMHTKFGEIAQTLSEIKIPKSPMQQKLEKFGKQISIIGVIAAFAIFILSLNDQKTITDSFIFAVSLAVAIIPEGLPAVMTITLSIGVEKMAKKRAIVTKLNAIETLGTITMVATDKTGTITTNKMSVKKIWSDNKNYEVSNLPKMTDTALAKMILNGILCSTASLVIKMDHGVSDVIGDPTEGALLLLAQKFGLIPDQVKKEWQIVDELSFNAVTKRMTVHVVKNKENMILTKGAPESILQISDRILLNNKIIDLSQSQRTHIENEFALFAKQGLRTIAFSYKTQIDKTLEEKQIFLGFMGISDPIRPGIKEAVEKARLAGIKTVMITGDSALTAQTIGVEAGIIKHNEDVLEGYQLDNYSDEKLLAILDKVKIFARTTPKHKYRLVKLLQKKGEIVAVTGDGINDALALKQANVGVAMGITGTDVAKETAHMILTDDNFATLIVAIEQGRNIYNKIINVIKYLFACNIGEVFYIFTAVVFKLPVLTPLQILYINLVTDGLPAISLAFSPDSTDVMNHAPRRDVSLFKKQDFKFVFVLGFFTAMIAFLSILPFGSRNEKFNLSLIFTTIIFIQPFILSGLWQHHKNFIKHFSLFLKPIFLSAFLFPFLLQMVIVYLPLFQQVFSLSLINPLIFIYAFFLSATILIPLELIKHKII